MAIKRIIPCLDVRNGKLTKGIKFQGNVDIGDPIETAKRYSQDGADEIIFYDITASHEGRSTMLKVAEAIAASISVPFCVGGGISTLEDIGNTLAAGATKVSINSAAVTTPQLISEGASAFGSQCILVALDVLQVPVSPLIPSGYEIVIHGGRKHMGIDAVHWAKKVVQLGAGELCVNSIDADGTKDGYDLILTRLIAQNVQVPVIASGGAGHPQHLVDAVTIGGASAALVASIVHYGQYTITDLKRYMSEKGVSVQQVP